MENREGVRGRDGWRAYQQLFHTIHYSTYVQNFWPSFELSPGSSPVAMVNISEPCSDQLSPSKIMVA